MTFRHGSITTTVLPSKDVRIANSHDTLRIELADLDDAIMGLCEVKRLLDPEGYLELVDRKLFPYDAVVSPEYTAAELLRVIAATTGQRASDAVKERDLSIVEAIRGRAAISTVEETHEDAPTVGVRIPSDPRDAEIERLRTLLDESTTKWAAFSHDCYTTHYMLPEGGCGVYLDGFREKARRDEIRREAGLPELLPPPLPTSGQLAVKVAEREMAARSRPLDAEVDLHQALDLISETLHACNGATACGGEPMMEQPGFRRVSDAYEELRKKWPAR